MRNFAIAIAAVLLLSGCAKSEEKAETHLKNGLKLIAEKKDIEARLELLNSIKYKADSIPAWRALVDVNSRTGAKSQYVQALRRLIELDPANNQAKINLAKLMLRGNAADAALRMIDSVSGEERNAEFHGVKAGILAATKDTEGALLEARRAVEIDPTNADAALILAYERIARGDSTAALSILNQAKATDPSDTRLALLKVQLFVRNNNFAGAEAELRNAVESNPEELPLRSQLAEVLARQGKKEDAETQLRAIAEAKPSDSKAGLDLVRFILSSKGQAAARKEVEERIAKGGEVFPYQLALVDMDVVQKNVPEATTRLEKLIADSKTSADKDAARVKLAEIKILQKDMAGAETLIADAIRSDRRSVGALRLRAAISLDKGQFDSAIADLREVLNEQPKAPDILLMLAQAYERSGQAELVERQYADAVRATEYDPAVSLRYAAYLRRIENLALAEEVLIESGRRNPRNVELFSTLAQIRLLRRNWSGALEIADALARNEPTKSVADQIRAGALAGQNKPEESIAALENAHRAAPNAMGPVVALVRAYSAQKKFDLAETLLRDLSSKHPTSGQPLILLGQVQMLKGTPADAQKSFEAAVVRAPSDPSTYNTLADFHLKQKNPDQALLVVQTGLKEMPDNFSLRMMRAGAMDAKEDHEAAIAEYESILKDQPSSLVVINNLASMILDNRTDKESLERAQGLVERLRDAKVPQFSDTVGWALHLRGDHQAALPYLEQARSQLPNEPVVRFHLGMLYRSLGQEAKAIEELNAASLLVVDGSTLKKKIQSALN